jgi:hypothetical protein
MHPYRRLVALALLCAGLALAACSPKFDWREFHADDGGFTVLLPQKPGQAERRFATPLGDLTMKMYSVRIDDTVLGAGYADLPKVADAHVVDVMRDALVKSLGGTLVEDKPLPPSTDGTTGREIRITGKIGEGEKAAPAEMRARLLIRENRYFQVVLAGRQGAFDTGDADMFLNSFKAN